MLTVIKLTGKVEPAGGVGVGRAYVEVGVCVHDVGGQAAHAQVAAAGRGGREPASSAALLRRLRRRAAVQPT